jgi:multidrug efflux pump
VIIFRTQEAQGGHGHLKREALPWWSLPILGGLGFVWLWRGVLAGRLGMPVSAGGPEWVSSSWWTWFAHPAFAPAALVLGLAGKMLIVPINAVLGWLFRGFNRAFDAATEVYAWTIGKMLRVSALVLLGYGGLLALTVYGLDKAPKGFIPQQDQGRLILGVQLPDSASLQRTQEVMAKVSEIALATPGVAHMVGITGMSFVIQTSASNVGSGFIVLKPFHERQAPGLGADAIMRKLRREFVRKIKEADVFVRNSSPIPGLGAAGGFKLMVEDRGGRGLAMLQEQTDHLVDVMKQHSELSTASTQFRSSVPQLYLDIDRTKAQALGLSFQDVNQTLSMGLGSLYVNSFNAFGRHWQVNVQLEGSFRNRPEHINLLQVRNKWGQMVPMGTLVKTREVGGPISVTRYNLYQTAAISGNVPAGVSTGDTIAAINRIADENLPLSMKADWTEVMFLQIRAEEKSPAAFTFALSAISVFLALAALYESWLLPMAVILVVPMCLLCSLGGVLGTGRDVNIFVQIGLVVLVGLACKNAILIVEYAKEKHMEGWSRADATVEACRLRLRPILMTSLAFIIGVIPLAIASGAGSEMRRSLGIAVFYGMVGVTLFGIFLTPVFFYVIQGLSEAWQLVTAAVRWVGSTVVGGASGAGLGYLLARADVLPMQRALWGCGAAGVLGTMAFLSFRFSVFRFQRRRRKPGGPPPDDESFDTGPSAVPEERESPMTAEH